MDISIEKMPQRRDDQHNPIYRLANTMHNNRQIQGSPNLIGGQYKCVQPDTQAQTRPVTQRQAILTSLLILA
jgi:hypothetical protein